MNNLIGKIKFKKFNDKNVSINFSSGINIIYGESGVGKSLLINSILKKHKLKSLNFEIVFYPNKLECYRVSQNPDNQLLSTTVSNELTFAGECKQKTPIELKKILDEGLKCLPNYISPKMNPGYLSGGEKEQLNLITALGFNPDILLIDDGLSFLSDLNKKKYVKMLNHWVRKTSGIIIWVTSEYSDMEFGNKSWVLCLDAIEICNNYKKKEYPYFNINKGLFNCSVNKLSFSYNDSRNIFSELSIDIKNVRSLGLHGENGSGKTTFAGLCFGDLKPNYGSINLNLNGNKNIKIGYLDQFPEHLIQLKTINEFYKKLLDNNVFDISFENTFKKRLASIGVKWDYVKDKRGIDLPWAMLRMLLIVLLSHCKYKILILDEPTFGLGWKQRVKLRSFIKGFMTRMHFIIISHDLKFVDSICDQVIYFHNQNIEHSFVRKKEDA